MKTTARLMWMMVAVFSLAAPLAAKAAIISYAATLSGAAENPVNASPGTGVATVTYDDVAHTLRVQVNFSGLTGTTTAAHIHCCVAAPGNAGVATPAPTFPGFPAGVTSGSYDQLFDLTLASSFNAPFVAANGGTAAGAEATLSAGMQNVNAYFNIHTSTFPGGEIRGFLQAARVPEPQSAWLIGLALLALSLVQRRHRA